MFQTTIPSGSFDPDEAKKRALRPPMKKRVHSASPVATRPKSTLLVKKVMERRCHSVSPSAELQKKSKKTLEDKLSFNSFKSSTSKTPTDVDGTNLDQEPCKDIEHVNKEPALPQCVITKVIRILASKKREFIKSRKVLIAQQNTLLEQLAAVKELEVRAGVSADESTAEIRIFSLSGWPAHDILLLVRDDLQISLNSEIRGHFGPQTLEQLHANLKPIPEDILKMGTEIMARRMDLLNMLRSKHRADRATYVINLEWKTRNTELDFETDQLQKMVTSKVENLKAKLAYCLNLAKMSWIDRETLTNKVENLQKDKLLLQHKLEELSKKDKEEAKVEAPGNSLKLQTVTEELAKEKAAREALKEVVAAAESMLRVARARITTLERQLKESKAELEANKRKQKDLEQLYRNRETNYDARSKKLLETSKTGEIAIETLSRQRNALELRVKELQQQADAAEKAAQEHQAERKMCLEATRLQLAEQDKMKQIAESRVAELETRVKELEEQNQALKEHSVKLVNKEQIHCLEYIPTKENEPSERETELWQELQKMRGAMVRAEEEVRQSRDDKDSFLKSLNRIALEGDAENVKDKLSTELVERERKIFNLQRIIEGHCENEKNMEQTLKQYENQLATLRLEVKRLRNYECYNRDIPHQELQTELLELHMQVDTLSRERTALVTAAASRGLMLERHERAAELFVKMIRARRNLAALLDGHSEPPRLDELTHAEVSRSLSSVCAKAADTWTALRAERARVLRLESAVLSQNLQLEREGMVRTQLERRRAVLERELLRMQHSSTSIKKNSRNKLDPPLTTDKMAHLRETIASAPGIILKGAAPVCSIQLDTKSSYPQIEENSLK